jgi:succinate dehydrogenase/fumarate reductase flavoprotein subunit
MQDIMYVNIKVHREAKILELTQDKFQEIRDRYDKVGFSTKVLAYQNKILK